jgi:uncharacterized YigZ family protein
LRRRYFTLKSSGQAKIEINKSIFICHATRTETEEQALNFATKIRKQHHDATHNCFACIVGPHDDFQKADDDGEPSGTAGKPMLEVIKKNKLSDTSLVITRFFGGTKLGSGGLIRAYGKAASEGIRAVGLVERVLHSCIGIEIAYNLLGALENALHNCNFPITDKQFTNQVRLCVMVEKGNEIHLQKLVTDITSGTACFSDQGFDYIENDVDCKEGIS